MMDAVKRFVPWLHGLLAYLAWWIGSAVAPRWTPRGPGGRGRVCVIQVNALGDVLMATPVLRALVEALGPGLVDVVLQERTLPLLGGFPGIGQRLSLPGTLRWRSPRSIGAFCRLVRRLRREHYWAILDCSRLLQSAWLTYLARPSLGVGLGIPRRLGPVTLSRLEYLYTNEVPADLAAHMIRQNLALLGALGIPAVTERMILNPGPADEAAAESWLATHDLWPDAAFAVIHPGAKWPPRRWPAERFRLLGARLLAWGVRVVCIGDTQDRALLQRVSDGLSPAPAILAGELTLGALAALIRRSCVFIGNDSGPMHLACAVDTPVVALFGPSHVEITGPLSVQGTALTKPIACRPCRPYFTRDRCERGHNECLDLILVDEVWNAVRSALDRRGIASSTPAQRAIGSPNNA